MIILNEYKVFLLFFIMFNSIFYTYEYFIKHVDKRRLIKCGTSNKSIILYNKLCSEDFRLYIKSLNGLILKKTGFNYNIYSNCKFNIKYNYFQIDRSLNKMLCASCNQGTGIYDCNKNEIIENYSFLLEENDLISRLR